MAQYYRNMGNKRLTQVPSNRFEVLKDRVIQRGEGSSRKIVKDRREILREEKAKRGVEGEVRKIKVQTQTPRNLDKEELLREVMVKIGLERIDIQKGIIVEALLDNRAIGLVISSEFARKQDFKLKRIERPIYMRNVDGSLNKEGSIKYIVECNIYYQGYREKTEIDMIEE